MGKNPGKGKTGSRPPSGPMKGPAPSKDRKARKEAEDVRIADDKRGRADGGGKDMKAGPRPADELGPSPNFPKAVGAALAINVVMLVFALIPFVGPVFLFIISPYIGSFIAGRYLEHPHWLKAGVLSGFLWAGIETIILAVSLDTISPYGFRLEMYGMMVIGLVLAFNILFMCLGFYQGTAFELEAEVTADGT